MSACVEQQAPTHMTTNICTTGEVESKTELNMSFCKWSSEDFAPWSCSVCTFLNDNPRFLVCNVCGAERPPMTLPDRTTAGAPNKNATEEDGLSQVSPDGGVLEREDSFKLPGLNESRNGGTEGQESFNLPGLNYSRHGTSSKKAVAKINRKRFTKKGQGDMSGSVSTSLNNSGGSLRRVPRTFSNSNKSAAKLKRPMGKPKDDRDYEYLSETEDETSEDTSPAYRRYTGRDGDNNSTRDHQGGDEVKDPEELAMSFCNWSMRDFQCWTCVSCQFLNENARFLTCEVCGQDRPTREAQEALEEEQADDGKKPQDDFKHRRSSIQMMANEKLIKERLTEHGHLQDKLLVNYNHGQHEGSLEEPLDNNVHHLDAAPVDGYEYMIQERVTEHTQYQEKMMAAYNQDPDIVVDGYDYDDGRRRLSVHDQYHYDDEGRQLSVQDDGNQYDDDNRRLPVQDDYQYDTNQESRRARGGRRPNRHHHFVKNERRMQQRRHHYIEDDYEEDDYEEDDYEEDDCQYDGRYHQVVDDYHYSNDTGEHYNTAPLHRNNTSDNYQYQHRRYDDYIDDSHRYHNKYYQRRDLGNRNDYCTY